MAAITIKAPGRCSVRYYCERLHTPDSGVLHDSGVRTPQRARCRYCGGAFVVERGHWGVFSRGVDHRRDAALFLHPRQVIAERMIAETGRDDLVARWVEAEDA
jgi:hypothetical protein